MNKKILIIFTFLFLAVTAVMFYDHADAACRVLFNKDRKVVSPKDFRTCKKSGSLTYVKYNGECYTVKKNRKRQYELDSKCQSYVCKNYCR